MPRECKNSPDKFCYIYKRQLTQRVKKLYELYFGCKVGDQDKSWAPHICCVRCTSSLSAWVKGKGTGLMFGVPMVWREPKDHSTDCYFCLTDIKGRNRKGKKSIVYPDLQSAIRPVLHSSDIPVPQPPSELPSDDTSNSDDSESQDATYTTQLESDKKPHLITQPELNDLVRDLTLTKQQSELLASRLQQWHLLDEEARITVFRKRSANLQDFFTLENNLTYCNDIRGLFSALELSYEPNEWRLFIDGSLYSIKAVLLHIGNAMPSVPVAYSVILRETYENLAFILDRISYKEYEWLICADLKTSALLRKRSLRLEGAEVIETSRPPQTLRPQEPETSRHRDLKTSRPPQTLRPHTPRLRDTKTLRHRDPRNIKTPRSRDTRLQDLETPRPQYTENSRHESSMPRDFETRDLETLDLKISRPRGLKTSRSRYL
ncbi:uncharacterized protein LOC143034826 [Oratosquilla oratoria]|uniref:uncharacterized protein LOC143034826 n=1 Tax=Oratosquilla oratoria TaxID=337810 RepID=UPI003F77327B